MGPSQKTFCSLLRAKLVTGQQHGRTPRCCSHNSPAKCTHQIQKYKFTRRCPPFCSATMTNVNNRGTIHHLILQQLLRCVLASSSFYVLVQVLERQKAEGDAQVVDLVHQLEASGFVVAEMIVFLQKRRRWQVSS